MNAFDRRVSASGSPQPPHARLLPLPDLPHGPAERHALHRGPGLVRDREPKAGVVPVPSLGRDDVPCELAGAERFGRSIQSGLAQREQVEPAHGLRRAVIDRGGPVYGHGVEQADRRGDVEEIGLGLAEPVLKARDLGFDLSPLEKELSDDEGRCHPS